MHHCAARLKTYSFLILYPKMMLHITKSIYDFI